MNTVNESDIGRIRRNVKVLQLAVLALTLAWLGSTAWLMAGTPAIPPVLTVERLEVVEPDGAPALIIANSQRPVAATVDGRVMMEGQKEARRGIPSIIFFNGKGEEIGGMLFGVRETSDGFRAIRHFSLDGYKQDQTVQLIHAQDPSGSTSGLRISNRPEHSYFDTLRQLGLEPGATREELRAAVRALPEEGREARVRELFGTQRAFFGSNPDDDATLVLKDGSGRNRIVITAPREGDPSIVLLDEDGKPVLQLPNGSDSG